MGHQIDNYLLSGKVAVVTGGGKGLGKHFVRDLLEEGMKVAFCGRDQARLQGYQQELELQFPGQVLISAVDVSQAEQVEAFKQKILDQWGSVHVLINNSGFGKSTLVWETPEADWDEVMDTNVKGAYLMMKAFVPIMIEQQEGYVLNVASQAALNGYSQAGVYCASKFALLGLAQSLQEEVRPYGIHVHTLNPALIQSQKQDGEAVDPGLIQNEDLSALAVYLLKQPRRLKIDNIGLWGF